MSGVGTFGPDAGIAAAPAGSRIAVIDFGPGPLTVSLLVTAPDGTFRTIESRSLPPVSAADLTEMGLPAVVGAVVNVLRTAGITSPADLHALYLSGAVALSPLVQQAFRPLCADQRPLLSRPSQLDMRPVRGEVFPKRPRILLAIGIACALVVVIGIVVGIAVSGNGSHPSAVADSPSVALGVRLGSAYTAVDSAAGRLYVADQTERTVVVVDIANHTVVEKINLSGDLVGLALDPALHRLYVAGKGDSSHELDGPRAMLAVVDTTTNVVINWVDTGKGAGGVAVDPVTHLVYVTTEKYVGFQQDPTTVDVNATASISVIDPSSATVVASIPVGTSAAEIAVDPAGRTAYVAGSRYDPVTKNGHGVIVVDLAAQRVTGLLAVPTNGMVRMAVDFAANTVVMTDIDNVYLVDLVTHALVAKIGGTDFGAVAVDPARHRAYVVENSGDGYQLRVVDTARRTDGTPLRTGMKSLVGSTVDPQSHVLYALVGDSVLFIPASN
ncbi:YncE family protein [Nocardia sp. CDC160]|uniref:YncE family protein n=1 Tax=Nocardia sp. CDC160 TaxID=3112166 RepID=UPI002DB706BF|nr:YncE family protein [Nocardia sp. CDC160]MEC3913338.1 YncE family protein [Nocardia sp. CDC160]